MQTGKHAANVGSRLKLAWKPGRHHLKSQPSSRIGENPPYGMIGGIEETSASFEARSAPRSYPTEPHRPESCADTREGIGEALTGERIGQPLSRESTLILGADVVPVTEGNTDGRDNASAQTARRGLRHWHVRTLFAREPGGLMVGQRQHACCTGPRREGEEP